jgi:hypothetical protein
MREYFIVAGQEGFRQAIGHNCTSAWSLEYWSQIYLEVTNIPLYNRSQTIGHNWPLFTPIYCCFMWGPTS